MKIKRIIIASDNNTYYINYWPLIAHSWTINTDFIPTLFFIGNESDFKFKKIKQTEVHFIKPIKEVSPGKYARCIRILAPVLYPDDICLTTDIDIIPLDLNYFKNISNKYENYKIISFTSDAYPDQKWRMPLCYYCGSGKTFASIVGIDLSIKRTYNEYIKIFNIILTKWHFLNFSNTTDEYIFSILLHLWDKGNIIKIPRVTNKNGVSIVERIETRLQLHKKMIHHKTMTKSILTNLKNKKYIDVSLPKPFHNYYNIIKPILDSINYKINPKKLYKYGNLIVDKHIDYISKRPKLSDLIPKVINIQKDIHNIINIQKNNYGIIIQARTSSTRLSGKIMKIFHNNKNILEIIIEKLKKCNIPLIVATTNNTEDDIICSLCDNLNIKYYRGSDENVLERFIETAIYYNINTIIRICSDNPFIEESCINNLITNFEELKLKPDYYSYTFNGTKPIIREHIGTFSELVTLDALIKIQNSTDEKIYKEHVTNYIYDNKQSFNIIMDNVPSYVYTENNQNNIRLTVDTDKDFKLLSKLYSDIYDIYGYNFTLKHIIDYLLENKNTFVDEMKKLILSNPK